MPHTDAVLRKRPRSYLHRPRLNKLLAEVIHNQVVVVCAGTGYGKTCAVYDYLHNSDAFRVWIQITERDNNVAHFWEHFIHSLSFYAKETAAKLIEEGFPATDSAFENYLRIPEEDITVNRKYVFVYDDFHLIHDKAVLRFIERSVNSDFPNITTVLITHTEPSINLIQLQAKGKVANITESELRFTEDEVSEYLRRQEIIVSSQNVMAICRDTEGWAFALNLIGMVLKNRPDDLHHATVTMKSNVFKLLELEVFFNLTEPMRRLLLRLSLIDQQPGELVYQIADDPNLVLELESVSSYLRYDSYIDTYLFHHLFRDYLRQKQDLLTQEEKNDTYLIAARWCEEHNYKIDAITYYEKSGHFDALARIAYDLPVQISVATSEYLLGIIDKIPAEQRMGIVLYPAIKLRLLINLRRLDEASALAHQYLAQFESLPVTAFNDRVLTGIYTAIAYIRFASALTTDIYDFDIYFKKADEHYTRHPFTVSGPTRNHVLGPWISWVGTTRKEAHEEYISALERSVPHVAHYLGGRMAGMDNLARGEFYFFQNDLQAAEQYVTRAMISSRENNQSTIHGRALFYLMRICLAHGDYARIEQIIGELETLSKTRNYANGQVRFDLVTSRYHLMLGQPQLVTDWLKLDFEKAALPRFLEDTSNFIKMKFHYVTQRYHPLLAFISSDKRLKKFLFGRIELKVMEAVCHYQIKDRVAALSALCEAHELSLSNKLIMPFVEFGKDMRTLTTAAMRDKSVGIPRAWLELINRKSTTYAKRLRLVTKAYKKAHRLGDEITLSPRESEVLADLCQGLSRSEIAVAHNLSINTVKLVVNALYIKLDAGNIADLIRIAVEKKLIP